MTQRTDDHASPRSLDGVLTKLEPQWKETQSHGKDRRILRLSVLRELTRTIHTLRSEFMATDRSGEARDLARIEQFLSSYFSILDIENTALQGLLRIASTTTKPSPVVELPKAEMPEALLRALGNAKLSRQDRLWESEIAQEALRLGWEFWQFEASTEIHDVERFARTFASDLWPKGVVLYVESDGFLQASEKNPAEAFWRGRWIFVRDPMASDLPGMPLNPQADPKWARLYPLC